jgi:hypothetical protein
VADGLDDGPQHVVELAPSHAQAGPSSRLITRASGRASKTSGLRRC